MENKWFVGTSDHFGNENTKSESNYFPCYAPHWQHRQTLWSTLTRQGFLINIVFLYSRCSDGSFATSGANHVDCLGIKLPFSCSRSLNWSGLRLSTQLKSKLNSIELTWIKLNWGYLLQSIGFNRIQIIYCGLLNWKSTKWQKGNFLSRRDFE